MKQNTRSTKSVEGSRDIFGLRAGEGGRGAKYWQQVLAELKTGGFVMS
ncbi:hypothetical protein [Acrocarpospora phusangensis]|nr:hypothetical protein [Acrocarpospora phusangensis]